MDGITPNGRREIVVRAKAALLGMAVGDAFGAPVEFMTSGEIKAKYSVLADMVGGGWLRLRPGQITDDTEMSLCIARAICSTGSFSLKSIADHFAAWLKSGPIDVGGTCRRGIRSYLLNGLLEAPHSEWAAGNGAVMRMVPVALFTLGDDPLLQQSSLAQAHLTHNNQLSDAACLCYGRLIHHAVLGGSKNRLRREVAKFTEDFPRFRFAPYPGLATGYVVDTMQTVLHHFFRCRSFEECLITIVGQGGDADTTGAIAGGLAGAYYGMEAIPRRWLKKMDKRLIEELLLLAERLILLSPALSQAKRCT